MHNIDPLVAGVAILVVCLQAVAFMATIAFARQMQELFATSLQVHCSSPLESPILVRRSGVLRFTIRAGAGSGISRQLIERLNLAADVPKSIGEHLKNCREIAVDWADRLDTRASQMAGVPVYLGLMGTFAGIIVGLLRVAGATGFSEASIQVLLSGVLVAMTSSLAGVALMVAGTAVVLPRARMLQEHSMGVYLATIQQSLMAVEWPDHESHAEVPLAEAVVGLTTALEGFSRSVGEQRQIFESLHTLDLPRVVKVNADLLGKVQPLLVGLAKFEESVKTMTDSLNGSRELVDSVNRVMNRVSSFEENVNRLGAKLAGNDTITARTVELIGRQIDQLSGRTKLAEQYFDLSDDALKEFAVQHHARMEKLSQQAAQLLDQTAAHIAKEIELAVEPERVASLLEHVASLPAILVALRESEAINRLTQQQVVDSVELVAESANDVAEAFDRYEQTSLTRLLLKKLRLGPQPAIPPRDRRNATGRRKTGPSPAVQRSAVARAPETKMPES